MLALNQRRDDGTSVISFPGSVSGDRSAAFTVVARIHHRHAEIVPQQHARVRQHSCAIIRHAVEQQHPIAIRRAWAQFPASQRNPVRSRHVEVFANCIFFVQRFVRLSNQLGGQIAFLRMD